MFIQGKKVLHVPIITYLKGNNSISFISLNSVHHSNIWLNFDFILLIYNHNPVFWGVIFVIRLEYSKEQNKSIFRQDTFKHIFYIKYFRHNVVGFEENVILCSISKIVLNDSKNILISCNGIKKLPSLIWSIAEYFKGIELSEKDSDYHKKCDGKWC